MLWLWDPRLLLFLVPGLLLGLWAQSRIRSAYAQASRIRSRRGLSGAQTARVMMDEEDVRGVEVESTPGFMTDHYHPLLHKLRLSDEVYTGNSLAAVGIAGHEVGHAIQHARHYVPMYVRSALVPLHTVGSVLGQLALGVGAFLAIYGLRLGQWMLLAGIAGFAIVFLFSLVTLPVEFNASKRAMAVLVDRGLVEVDELPEVKRVLNAAALTYVAAAVSILGTLLQLLFLYSRSRR